MEDNEHWTSIIEDLILINSRTPDEPREFKIRKSLTLEEQEKFIALLKEFMDVFAWSYKGMPGIDPDVAKHQILLYTHGKSIKQILQRDKARVGLEN